MMHSPLPWRLVFTTPDDVYIEAADGHDVVGLIDLGAQPEQRERILADLQFIVEKANERGAS